MRTDGLMAPGLFVLGFVALMPLPGAAVAQQADRTRVEPEVTIISAEGAGPDFDTRTLRHGFDLFANAGAAFSGMRATGNYAIAINNYGPCNGTLVNCLYSRVWVPARNAWIAPWFEIEYYAGAPPSQYAKIVRVAPSVANAIGGGWTANHTRRVVGNNTLFGPADGSLGRLFSGVISTADGSCRDHTQQPDGWYPAGFQLLPISDCPETWGGEGWTGARPIDAAGWKRVFDREGDGFRWDYWRVPEADQRTDRPFLGTNHHTYGESSDYNAETLLDYGSAVPGGVGVPRTYGYPLGLLLRFDAFNFADPRVSGAHFVQVTIVNRSSDLWGAPIDYDSLYFGLGQGTLNAGGGAISRYALPDRGLVLYHQSNVQGAGGPCDDASRLAGGGGCTSSTSAVRGYGAGAVAKIFLKTPLGDLRNKLFTRTAAGTPCVEGEDPFCRPSHPLAGDTITFNQQNFGDYGGAYQYTWGNGAQSAFGFISADEANTLAGRDPGTATDRQLWTTFRSEDWLTNKVHYNKYVPPASPPWDYNHDGIPDTLGLATCGRSGCAALDSDTMPGGWLNRRGNMGGIQGFGPFSLRAGDSTAFVYAMVGDGDSAAVWAQIDAAIDLYLNFYASPEPPPPARILTTTVTPGTDAFGTASPELRFSFSDDPVRWVDPYLLKLADDVEAAAPGTTLGTLRTLNDGRPVVVMRIDTLPGPVYDTTFITLNSTNLVSALRERAAANLQRIEIYKSCDGGRSYTGDADCRGDPAVAVDGTPAGLGWRSYASFSPGTIPTSFTDPNVQAGGIYRYVMVAQSRGATFVLNTPNGETPVAFAPSLRSPLSPPGDASNVVGIYVPASRPAGYRTAQTSFSTRPVGATAPFVVDLGDASVGGTYQAIFGNQLIVVRDSLVSLGAAVRSTVTIRRRRRIAPPVGLDSTVEARVYDYPFADVFPVAGSPTGSSTATIGDTVRTTTWYYALAFVLVGPDGPVFGSRMLTGSNATPAAAFEAPRYPGFSITADNTLATAFNAAGELQIQTPAGADTVARAVVDQSMVQWQEVAAQRIQAADGTGRYEISWQDDPFGLSRGLMLDLAEPGTTTSELLSALAGRAVGGIALTDSATAALLYVDQSELVPLSFPFTVRNRTFARPVAVAALRRLDDVILLGSGDDTISVEIPDNVWVPGDRLVFIEDIREDSLASGGLVLDSLGQPAQRLRRAISFSRAVLGCDTPRLSCNPLRDGSPGATGYVPMLPGDRTEFEYYAGFPETGAFTFEVLAAVTGTAVTVTDSALRLIRVVPNPYVVYSAYQTSLEEGRLLFTNMPPAGTLRIYTVAGQFVQQITWEPPDLEGDGDLYWNLRTRGGLDVASGLYLWVLNAPSDPGNPASTPLRASGKFVIIR